MLGSEYKTDLFDDVVFEDVSDDLLVMEDCLIVLEPFGSFPGSGFRAAALPSEQ